jgi:hypothetical protein
MQLFRRITGPINISKMKGSTRELWAEFNGDSLTQSKSDRSMKDITIPANKQTPRSTSRRNKSNIFKISGTEFGNICLIKDLPFCLLQTDKLGSTFWNLVMDVVPFYLRINTSNVLGKHTPRSIGVILIHVEAEWGKSGDSCPGMSETRNKIKDDVT